MSYKFSKRSLSAMEGIHPDLRKVLFRALEITAVDFVVIEGLRTRERQRALVAMGASETMRSRHLTGHAVDIVPWIDGDVSWAWPAFYPLADAMKLAARELEVKIEWGGDWRTFRDGPHFQLSRSEYPEGDSY